jgi:hypothetical protein
MRTIRPLVRKLVDNFKPALAISMGEKRTYLSSKCVSLEMAGAASFLRSNGPFIDRPDIPGPALFFLTL